MENDEPEIIMTDIFRMSGSTFIRLMIGRYGLPWISTAVFLSLGILILAFTVDIRWLIVFLMILFLFIPLVAAFFYFQQGLKEITVLNTISHRLIFRQDEMKIECYNDPEDVPSFIKTLPYSDFSRYLIGGNYLMVPLKDSRRGFVWIPANAFSQNEMLKKAVDMLYEKLFRQGKTDVGYTST
ncbi:MAG: hypothetical protein K2J82_02360 [Muribaculaceae bacterium]|nr:hypothetical protein [Muribaculaceae bacterium]